MSATSTPSQPALRAARAPWIAGAALLALYAAFMGDLYGLRLLTQAGVYALLVIGYQFVFGHAGAFSLAQGAFFGLGAYVTGILGVKFGWGFLTTFPLSILLPAAFALLVAAPVLRLETHYFALATLGLAQVALIGAVNWESLTGGANGLVGVPRVTLFGTRLVTGWPLLLFVWSLVALGGLLAWRLTRGMKGLAYQAVRERPLAAASVGIDGGMLRATAFVLSAAYGGAAGALHATSLGVLSPEVFDFSIMVACLTMAVVGGRGRIAGAILGAVLLVHLPEWLRGLEQYYLIAYGAALLLVVILTPDGLAGLVDRFWRRGRKPGETLPFVPASARGSHVGGATLHVEDLAKSFGGVAALDGVSLRVAPGEIVGLIGPNGSGKSTLANLITGVYRPDRGRIRLDATPLETLRPHEIARLGVRRTFQTAELIAGASLIDNVAVAYAAAANPSLPHARSRALTVLSGTGLTARAWEDAAAQPAGVRRLAEVARATVRGPRLLVLDEPSAGLTEDERTTLTCLLRNLAGQGAAILVIDHNVPFLSGLAGRLVCLETGRVIADGAPDVVLADAAVRRAYLGTAEKKAVSALLELRGVTVAYGGAPVVEDVSLTLGFREVAALLGANGAGKSTLLKAIMGLAPLVRGEILLHGERLNGIPPEERARRWGIAYVPEGRRIFGGMTVRENLEVGAWCDGVSRRRRLDETFFLFPQLAEKSSARAWTLSGGQQQMLAIGRALMQAPSLLLLDEPFLGLAPVLMRDVVNQIRAAAVGGPGILVAEQAFDAAASLAPRGYAMRLGRVTAQGTLAELRDSGMLAESLLPR